VTKHLAGNLWGYAEDGVQTDYVMSFLIDGKIKREDTGKELGTWDVRPGNKVALNMDGTTQLMHFAGSHMATAEHGTAERPDSRAALLYGGSNQGAASTDWQVIFEGPPGTFPSGQKAFLGFTGYTGSKSYIEVDVHRLDTVNFDLSRFGEEAFAENDQARNAWWKMLEEEKRFVSQASQGEAVSRLSKLLVNHASKCEAGDAKMKEDLADMETRLDTLSSDMATYLAATRAFSFDSSSFDFDSVKGHIHGIKSILTKSKDAHNSKMAEAQEYAKRLKATGGNSLTSRSKVKLEGAKEQSKSLEQHAAAGSLQTNVLFVVMVLSVGGLVLLFFSRMNYYEKKHYI